MNHHVPSTNDEHTSAPPWYKQFWPWFIIAIPLASVIAGINMIIISIDGADDLVKTNYYKEGLAINQQFELTDKAREMEIHARVMLKSPTAQSKDAQITLDIRSKNPITEPLFLDFHHATIEERDFRLPLQQQSNGLYFAPIPQNIYAKLKAKWYIELSPYSKQWALKEVWYLPSTEALTLGASE